MEVILLRHSVAEGNREKRFIGTTDAPLTAEGIALAKARAGSLPAIGRVYVSPLLRAKDTARLLWPGVPVTECADIREVDFGMLENKTHRELTGNPFYEEWLRNDGGEGYPGGERFSEFTNRVRAAFAAILRDAEEKGESRIGIVSHGGVIMEIINACKMQGMAGVQDIVPNCCGFRFFGKNAEGLFSCIEIISG